VTDLRAVLTAARDIALTQEGWSVGERMVLGLVLPPEIAAIEAERCGPYHDAFGLCTGCGPRGRVQHRCAADDPDRARESIRASAARSWFWLPSAQRPINAMWPRSAS
jgi:hypothetical protein